MNKPEPNGSIPIKVAFDCIKSVTLSKIFAATSDRVGVLLYNTVSREHEEEVYAAHIIDNNEIEHVQQPCRT